MARGAPSPFFRDAEVTDDDLIVASHRLIREIRPTAHMLKVATKPTGLWYACGDAWLRYISANPDWLDEVNYVYRLTLDYSAIVAIHTAAGVRTMTRLFGADDGEKIDWPRFARGRAGIEICPYQPSLRTGPGAPWYFAWDVASGCVWDPRAVKSLELLAQRERR